MNYFWQQKKLSELTESEWESLCDGCGKCCLVKLEDEETEDIFYTDVACKYLDTNTCQCRHYQSRKAIYPDCIKLKVSDLDKFHWLPETCAYRLVEKGLPLPAWHHLISGDKQWVHNLGYSVAEKVINESDVDDDDLQAHIIHWVN